MPGAVRKADAPLRSQPAAKKARTSSTSSKPDKSLKAAVFGNGKPLEAKLTGQRKNKSSHAVNEAAAKIVSSAGLELGKRRKVNEVVEISSDEESSDGDIDDSVEEQEDVENINGANVAVEAEANGVESDKENQMDVDADEAGAGPSFGELVASASEPIDVAAALATKDDASTDENTSAGRVLAPPSATSLATVLTQALRTNDADLLDSCLIIHDLDSVRATISRLPSPLVESLLLALADKLHKRPGRANNLMVWVQWSLVSHGGYLATKQDIVKKLGQLNRVIKERANGLQPLLALKGRLDMLWAQLELRRGAGEEARQLEEDDEEGLVVYVEGQEDEIKPSQGADDEDDDAADVNLDIGDEMELSADALARLQEEDDSEEVDDDSDEEVSDEGFSDQQEESDVEEVEASEDDSEDEPEAVPPPKKKSKSKSK